MKKTATTRKPVILPRHRPALVIDQEAAIDRAASVPTASLVPANSHLPERVKSAVEFMQMIDGTPMRDRILVVRANPKDEIIGVRNDGSEYRIVIPDIAQETQGVGMVVAAGSGHYIEGQNVPLDVAPFQIVFFNKYAGTETQVGPHKLLRLREEEIEFRANGEKCMALAAITAVNPKGKRGRTHSR